MTIIITAFEKSPDGGKGLPRDTRVAWHWTKRETTMAFAWFRLEP